MIVYYIFILIYKIPCVFQTEQHSEENVHSINTDETSSKEVKTKEFVDVNIGSAVEKASEELNESELGRVNLSQISESSETEDNSSNVEDTVAVDNCEAIKDKTALD